MPATTSRPKITVTADGIGVVPRAGSRLLGDIVTVTGLDAGFAQVAGVGRRRRSAHDPGRVLTDLAVMLADGGQAISDLCVLREQADLFGPLEVPERAGSSPDNAGTCWHCQTVRVRQA